MKGLRADKSVRSNKIYTVALTGNPNVGKSAVFNALTGMKRQTGNRAGKTVGCPYGSFTYNEREFAVVELPDCYTASADVGEEKATAEFLAYESADAAVTVCDANCLERSLILAFQVAEMSKETVICVNLLDEAEKKGLKINLERLRDITGLTVVGVAARRGKGFNELKNAVYTRCVEKSTPLIGVTVKELVKATHPADFNEKKHENATPPADFNAIGVKKATPPEGFLVDYGERINAAVNAVEPNVERFANSLGMRKRYLALELLKGNPFTLNALREGGCDISADRELISFIEDERKKTGLSGEKIRESVFKSTFRYAELVAKSCVSRTKKTSYRGFFRA